MTGGQAYLLLAIAIVAEVVATSALKASDGFTRFWPSVVTTLGYGAAFYLLSHVLKTVPTGVAYAVWSGGGIVLISLIAWVWFRQSLDLAAMLGIALILVGTVVVSLFSKSVAH